MNTDDTTRAFLHRELRALREAEVQARLKRLRYDLLGLENLEWCFEGNSSSPFRPRSWGRASRCGTLDRTRARMDRLRLEIEALEASLRRGIRAHSLATTTNPTINQGERS